MIDGLSLSERLAAKLAAYRNDFSPPELRERVFFTLVALALYRVGYFIPTPGVNTEALAILAEQIRSTMFGLYNVYSDGSLSLVTIFALGIMPYLIASTILQVLALFWPHLRRLSKEGELGRRRITRYARYLTLAAAVVQSLGIAFFLERQTQIAGGLPLVYVSG